MLEPNQELESMFERAVLLALEHKHQYITLEHFLHSMVDDSKFGQTLRDYGANVDELKANLDRYIKNDLVSIVSTNSNT